MFIGIPLCSLALVTVAQAQTYSATYLPSNAPNQTEQGQTGTNECGTGNSQNSSCQNVFGMKSPSTSASAPFTHRFGSLVNSIDDWCIFAPPEPEPNSTIGNTERIEVAWCTKAGHGTRLIPDGTITGAHFVQTPDYVEVLGVGNLTMINIPAGDDGGELDPHGADGNGAYSRV